MTGAVAPPAAPSIEPGRDCPLCLRLVAFREDLRRSCDASWHNAPVPPFGGLDARLLIVGLAPGLKGANRTGRPFTGDYAGDLLYPTLVRFGLAEGTFDRRADDGLRLKGCRITNAVRCLPPANKPTGGEIAPCRPFLKAEIEALSDLRVILALGRVAHETVLVTLGLRLKAFPFAHGAEHRLPDGVVLADSYHCSRYNTNTGRLTEAMFHAVLASVAARVSAAEGNS